jgi:hypothetical protein
MLALATYAAQPNLPDFERPLIGGLAALGIEAHPAVWSDPAVDWGAFRGVIIRSCWDYHLHHEDFFEWIDRLTRLGVRVWNAPRTLRWNSRKTYLHDLSIGGVRTVPTMWLLSDSPRARAASLPIILADTGWQRAVVKPIISASAHETWSVTLDDARENAAAHDARLHALIAKDGAMVQPFVPEYGTTGEWSFVFFRGVFSHAVVKHAAPGDFRVQRWFGGTYERMTPPPFLLQAAERALRAGPNDTLYARVDGVICNGDFVLTELELLDPTAYLDADPEAAARFANAIAAVC